MQLIRSQPLILAFSILACTATLGGCAHSLTQTAPLTTDTPWMQNVIDYRLTLPPSHPDNTDNILAIPHSIRQEVITRFSSKSKAGAAKTLATWLVSKNGHNMVYNVHANLKPLDAFEQKTGNCLSFTILLVSLARELDIELKFNEVDIPNAWNMDDQIGVVLYRHVNAVFKTHSQHRVFDLAMENYNFGYPQRIITSDQALAQLHSNRSVDALTSGELDKAHHLIQLAISLSPENADLWVNLGAVQKKRGQRARAEQSYLHALSLRPAHALVASNLERFYLEQSEFTKASKYRKSARKARLKNPYYHFELAKNSYSDQAFKSAKKSMNYAIRLHKSDPQFYELRSRIAQQLGQYKRALNDLISAYKLAKSSDETTRYASKAKLVAQKYVAQQERKNTH